MTEKDMKKLSRADLLQMLIDQSTEMKELQEKLEAAEKAREAAEEARRTAEEALKNREITLNNAGSIAEAALQLNGVFAAAQASCQQYIDNVRRISMQQEEASEKLAQESRAEAERRIAEAENACEKMKRETQAQCDVMLGRAKIETQGYWDEIVSKLDAYYEEHAGLRELLSIPVSKK